MSHLVDLERISILKSYFNNVPINKIRFVFFSEIHKNFFTIVLVSKHGANVKLIVSNEINLKWNEWNVTIVHSGNLSVKLVYNCMMLVLSKLIDWENSSNTGDNQYFPIFWRSWRPSKFVPNSTWKQMKEGRLSSVLWIIRLLLTKHENIT